MTAAARQGCGAWFVSERFDTSVCGGLMWLAVALHMTFVGATPAPVWLIAGLTHALVDTHIAATWHKVVSEGSVLRNRLVAVTTVLVFALLPFALLYADVREALFRFLPLVVIPHYARQSFGIAMLYCHRAGVKLAAGRKGFLSLVLNAATASLMARQLSAHAFVVLTGGNHYTQPVAPMWVVDVTAGVALGLALLFLVDYLRSPDSEKLPPPAMLLVLSMLGLLLLPNEVAMVTWLYAPALFHGPQYLVVAMKDAERRGDAAASGALIMEYLGKLCVITAVIYSVLPILLVSLSPQLRTLMGVLAACLTLHHGIVDGFIWRRSSGKRRGEPKTIAAIG